MSKAVKKENQDDLGSSLEHDELTPFIYISNTMQMLNSAERTEAGQTYSTIIAKLIRDIDALGVAAVKVSNRLKEGLEVIGWLPDQHAFDQEPEKKALLVILTSVLQKARNIIAQSKRFSSSSQIVQDLNRLTRTGLLMRLAKPLKNDEAILKKMFFQWRRTTEENGKKRMQAALLKLHQQEHKQQILNNSFSILASGGIIAVFVGVMYYNMLLLQPYLNPMLLAALVAFPLAYVKDSILSMLNKADGWRYKTSSEKHNMMLKIVSINVTITAVAFATSYSVLSTWLACISLQALFVMLLFAPSYRDYAVSVLLVVGVLFIVLFPLGWWLKNCIDESAEITEQVVHFLNTNEDLNLLIHDYESSEYYLRAVEYAESWGYSKESLDLDNLKDKATAAIMSLGDHLSVFFNGAFGVVQAAGQFVIALLFFLSTLFYFVSNSTSIARAVETYTPFTEVDHNRITNSLNDSVSKIFTCSAIIFTLHFFVTFVSFSVAGVQLVNIFAALSGFLATVPILGGYLLWIPASAWFFFHGQMLEGFIIVLPHFFSYMVVVPAVYSFLPGNPYLVGLSVVLGIQQFGVVGVIYGPILSGLAVTMLDLIDSFYSKNTPPASQNDTQSLFEK